MLNPLIDGQQLLRTVAHALRHEPTQYGLELDAAGWTDLDELIVALRFDRYDWALLERGDLERSIVESNSSRFEIRDDRIRAAYGHSVHLTKIGTPETLPPALWHGLPLEVLEAVMLDGLRPIRRRFVHLTTNPDYACQVARAKGTEALLIVDAQAADKTGGRFFPREPPRLAHRSGGPGLPLTSCRGLVIGSGGLTARSSTWPITRHDIAADGSADVWHLLLTEDR